MPKLGGTHAHNRCEAEMDELTRVLGGFGVLTGHWLRELSGARHWDGPIFEAVLCDAIRTGRIRKLCDDLYELGEPSSNTRS
jgi:hypothetical protein